MQHLLSHFKELTFLPKNVEELKGLILQLAIQGKLTKTWREENPDVEPASVLLERIKAEKTKLVKENKIPKEKSFPDISRKLVQYRIPNTWLWSNLGESIVLFSGRDLTPKEYSANLLSYPYLTGASQIKEDKIILNRWTDAPKVLSFNGDVLISVKGTIGKTIINEVGELHIARQIMALRSFGWIDNRFLKLFLDSYLTNLQEASNGIIPGISREHLLYAEFPLPPLKEQKAIVSIVNQLFAEVEQLEVATKERVRLKEDFVSSALRRLTEGDTSSEWAALQPHFKTFFTETKNIKSLRESILQLAVQGKLTRHWRRGHPELVEGDYSAKALLERIKAEKAQLIERKKVKVKHKLHQKAKSKPDFKVPGHWEIRRFWDVIWCFRGYNPPKSEFIDEPREGYVRFVQITDFKTDSRAVYVPDSHRLKRVAKGEILMAAYRHIGKLSRSMEGAFNVALCKVNCIEPYDIDFLELLIGTSIVKGELLSESERGHIPSMHTDHLLSLWVPIPPLEEQKVIVQKVNALVGLCDQLEKEIETQTCTLEEWMKSCLRSQ